VIEACEKIKAQLEATGVRVIFDNTDNSPGWKFNEWEMKGVPVRIEVGPRDLEAGKVILFRRDTLEKVDCTLDGVTRIVNELLKRIQKDMLESARVRRDERIVKASDLDGILNAVEKGNFVKTGWCGCRECEDKIKETTAASARVMLDELEDETCAVCGKKAKHSVYFARAY
ncbi:MAG: proline--tRNA ligase, partial [Clostridia bacterium]|nr:proline--tRNA ligase [Clostridia bacterium]